MCAFSCQNVALCTTGSLLRIKSALLASVKAAAQLEVECDSITQMSG
jgi:hypothetical protein